MLSDNQGPFGGCRMSRCLASWLLALLIPCFAFAQYGARPVPTNPQPTAGSKTFSLNDVATDDPVAPATPLAPAVPGPAVGAADKLTAIGQKLEELGKNLTVTTADPEVKIVFGGAIIADFLYNSA